MKRQKLLLEGLNIGIDPIQTLARVGYLGVRLETEYHISAGDCAANIIRAGDAGTEAPGDSGRRTLWAQLRRWVAIISVAVSALLINNSLYIPNSREQYHNNYKASDFGCRL
jgi:hypothetical protein